MFAPGFFTGHLIKRFGALSVMGVGVVLYFVCVAIALSGVELHHFTASLFLLGVGWNFLFTGGTSLALSSYKPEEKDRAQGAINFFMFAVMALSSFSSGALVSATEGWSWLNLGSLAPTVLMAAGILWLALRQRAEEPATA
jgi:MFS family permease